MAKLFRIENAAREGMYYAGCGCAEDMQPYAYDGASMRHPKPEDDSALVEAIRLKNLPHNDTCSGWGAYHYGFSSIDQLKMWVHRASWRQDLDGEGFKLSIYEVADEHFAAGDTQAVVLKDQPRTLIQQLNLLDI